MIERELPDKDKLVLSVVHSTIESAERVARDKGFEEGRNSVINHLVNLLGLMKREKPFPLL